VRISTKSGEDARDISALQGVRNLHTKESKA
jgi:hypothetical protein